MNDTPLLPARCESGNVLRGGIGFYPGEQGHTWMIPAEAKDYSLLTLTFPDWYQAITSMFALTISEIKCLEDAINRNKPNPEITGECTDCGGPCRWEYADRYE